MTAHAEDINFTCTPSPQNSFSKLIDISLDNENGLIWGYPRILAITCIVPNKILPTIENSQTELSYQTTCTKKNEVSIITLSRNSGNLTFNSYKNGTIYENSFSCKRAQSQF
jgi:hypothetical protein